MAVHEPDANGGSRHGRASSTLATLVAGELGIDDEPLLDTTGRHLRLGDQRMALTELELAFGMIETVRGVGYRLRQVR